MPSPYTHNDRAARYVDYYGSNRMVDETVNRLYHGGLSRKKAAEAKAEHAAYPPSQQVRRTQAEIDAYLESRVDAELLRRKQRRAALQQELYPEVELPGRCLTKAELDRHVRHMYTDPVRRLKLREREIERIFGKNKSVSDLGVPPTTEERREERRNKELNWRPPSAHLVYDDNRRYLVSQYDYYADPKRFGEVNIKERPMTSEERAAHMKRLAALARPHSVTPRVVEEERGLNDPKPFRVHRRVDYDDY